MPRYLHLPTAVKRIAVLLAMPLLVTSTAYALFSQQLSVQASSTHPVYTSSQNLRVTYTRSVAPAGQNWTHTISVTITNLSATRSVSAWQSTFSLPAGYSNVSCTSATCSQASNVNTAINTGTNGTIGPGGTATYTLVFRSALQTYKFTSIGISGTLVPIYQTMAGLTMTAVAGTRTKSGQWYNWPYTITVTNATGQNLPGWRITASWSSTTNRVSTMPATVNYTTSATQLTITSTQAINNGANFQFIPNLQSTNINWVLAGYSVEGQI